MVLQKNGSWHSHTPTSSNPSADAAGMANAHVELLQGRSKFFMDYYHFRNRREVTGDDLALPIIYQIDWTKCDVDPRTRKEHTSWSQYMKIAGKVVVLIVLKYFNVGTIEIVTHHPSLSLMTQDLTRSDKDLIVPSFGCQKRDGNPRCAEENRLFGQRTKTSQTTPC